MSVLTSALPIRSLRRARKSLLDYVDLQRQRRRLAAMDAAQLRDVGLTREQADLEAARYIWDAPNHWLR